MITSLLERPSAQDTDNADDPLHIACSACDFPLTLCGLPANGEWWPYPSDESAICKDCLAIRKQKEVCGFCGSRP